MKLLVTAAQRIVAQRAVAAHAHTCVRAVVASNNALSASKTTVCMPSNHWIRSFSTSKDDDKKTENDESNVDDDEEEEDDQFVAKGPKKLPLDDDDKPKKPWDFEFDEDDWDEERWGAMDSEDWQGFDGDIDAMTEEGVPTWLNAVRNLQNIKDEKKMRLKLARRAYEEAKMNVVRHRKVDEQGRAYGTGRRKTSTARVWIKEAATPYGGTITVNGKDFVDYFVRDAYREDVLKPFSVVGMVGQFDVYATVKGGGLTGQSGAVRHGISRALQHFDPALRPALKKEGLLTRDPRMVERKKAGQPKARKKFQWVKR